jgi:phosphoserine aminotransferase
MLILSPRAVQRLESDAPRVAIPKVFQLLKKGRLDHEIFKGSTINTPSMMCVADALDALTWMSDEGGLHGMIRRSRENFDVVRKWVQSSTSFAFLAARPEITSNTSVCLQIVDPWFLALDAARQSAVVSDVVKKLEAEQVAFDINAYRDAPPGLRIWCGPTVDAEDVRLLLPWIDWSYDLTRTSPNA